MLRRGHGSRAGGGGLWVDSIAGGDVPPRTRMDRGLTAARTVEWFHAQWTNTGLRSAHGRVAAIAVAEHARAPRGGEGTVARSRLPSESTAGGQHRRGPSRWTDRLRSCGLLGTSTVPL